MIVIPGRWISYNGGINIFQCIVTVTWYNAGVSKSQCKYRLGAVTFYFAILERARDQNELP